MKLIFKTDGKAMKWTDSLVVFVIVIIQVLGSLKCLVKEYFMEAVVL